jgi:hypothetical protein
MFLDDIQARCVAENRLERCDRSARHTWTTSGDSTPSLPPLRSGSLSRHDIRLHALDVDDAEATH